jgi:hypothetical protein
MHKRLLCAALFAVVLIMACAGSSGKFIEPTSEESMILIGRIIFEGQKDQEYIDIIKKGTQIGILGKTSDGKQLHYYAYTDEQGYFCVTDVPKGQYAIQGVTGYLSRVGTHTLFNPLDKEGSYYRFNRGEYYTFGGNNFAVMPKGRVINFDHQIFQIRYQMNNLSPLNLHVSPTLNQYKLLDNSVLNDGPVEDYFIAKYPGSLWKTELEKAKTK